ncbi:MAG: SdrD B-like domain-containing protein [Bacteroidota bacterium]
MKNLIPELSLPSTQLANTKTYNKIFTFSIFLCCLLFSLNLKATCDNVTDGGQIGYNQSICPGDNYDIENVALPSGGTGDLEYLWMANTTGPFIAGSVSTASSSSTFTTENLTVTTWFARFSRRDGCTTWLEGESNWIKITVSQAQCVNNSNNNTTTVTNGNENSGSNNDGKIEGIAFEDANADGLQDGSESGISGIEVVLLDSENNTVNQTFTTSTGHYEFTNIIYGIYKIQVNENVTSVITNYELTFANLGTDDDKDSDPIRTNNGMATTENITVSNGESNDNVDLGFFQTSFIGDEVFIDNNANGLNDNNDLPYEGVTVQLTGTNIFGNVVSKTEVSDNDGKYGFENLVAGDYTLAFLVPNAEFVPTEQNALANILEAVDSDIDELTAQTSVIAVAPGTHEKELDAGFVFSQVLPVDLTSFEAENINESRVALKWITASEQNNKHFIIEKSTDGSNFKPMGIVAGNGTTSATNFYRFEDAEPFYGNNYYRLKQVDFDGKFEYSKVEVVHFRGQNLPDMIVYPNPIQRSTTLRVLNPLLNDAKVEVVNQAGQTLQVSQLEKGNDQKQINMSNYPEGIYYLFVTYNGHRTQVSKLVKIENE